MNQEIPKQKYLTTPSATDLWDTTGIHRPLAGFWYNLAFWLIQAVVGLLVGTYLMKLLYPFPESAGYKTAGTAIFGVFFQIMDLGTANVVNRYLGEFSVKDRQKMLHYIQYFIWYQAFTGLLQTTAVSMYAIYYVPTTELAYAIWIMLLQSTTQFPGFLWIFKDILGSMQQFHKNIILGFLTGDIVQRITEIIFVLLGKYYGQMHPEIGMIMGIAYGSMIGLYVDDFIAMVISAYFFKGMLQKYDIKVSDCFRHDFDSKLVFETLWYGIRIGLPGLFWPLVGLFSLWLWILYVPQYTTFATLASFAGNFSQLTSQNLSLGGAISEAYMNGKKKLTQYYIAQAWRFSGFMQGFTISAVLIILPLIESILLEFGLEFYVLSISFIIPQMVRHFQQPYNNISEDIITQTNHANISMSMHFLEDILAFLSWALVIPVLQIPQKYGFNAIIWIIPCCELLAINIKVTINYILINKKILPLKGVLPYWQTWVAPALAGICMFILGRIVIGILYFPIAQRWGLIPSLAIMGVFGIIICPMVIFGPLTVMFGGWDDESLRIFGQVTKMSGPSKFLVTPIYWGLLLASKISPLHNRFMVPSKEALKEAMELTRQKHKLYISPSEKNNQ